MNFNKKNEHILAFLLFSSKHMFCTIDFKIQHINIYAP